MSWDHPVHSFSYPNGEPQTPTRTPPTNVFGDSAFQTPKLESSFFDPRVTWDTSDPYASSPEFLRTPQKLGLSTSSNNLQRLQGATTSQELSNARGTKDQEHQVDTARRSRPSKLNGNPGEDVPRTVESAKSAASIQTPPPSSASGRKVTGLENVANPDPGVSANGVLGGHLETPSRLMGTSPRLFGDLQASPDPFQFGSFDPSASPFFPQQKLFWDQDLEPQGSNLGGLSGDNMNNIFDSNTTGMLHDNHEPMPHSHIPQLPTIEANMELPDFPTNNYGLSSAAPTDAALFPAPFSTSPRPPMTKAEDPAMFLSSPARRFGGSQPSPERRLFSRPSRQPYHHQMEEFKREELRRANSVHHQLPGFEEEEEDDDFTPRQPQPIRPTLTRSLTHNAVTAQRPSSSASGMMASTNGIRKSPSKRGRSSPIKPLRQPLPRSSSAAAGIPTRSSSLVLKIGKDGRAKTEMQPVPESTGLTDPVMGMDLDGSTTESEYDSAEYSEYPMVPSRNPSFALSDAGRPMLARSDSGSRPHSKGSYASTTASSHSGRASPWGGGRGLVRRPTYHPNMDGWKRTPKKQSMMGSDLSYRSASSAVAPLPESEEDDGDAQHALRKVLRERRQAPRPHTVGYGSRVNRAPRSLAHLHSSPPRFGAELELNTGHPNTSPTTMTDPDLATPSTDRYSNPSNGTRCICNSMDNGGHLMIQCESCSHWLHTKCVGLERARLPSSYVCVFCAQTPTRTNRIRVPVGPVGHAPSSPLAHKSFRFR